MPASILIVDDEESIRYTFESFLSDEGHDVSTAVSYDEAVEKISQRHFDLIIADILLGGNTGIDLLREIRNRQLTSIVVMITGAPKIETAAEAVRMGAFDYIPKPVVLETLLLVVNRALQYKALQDERETYRSNIEAIFRSVKDIIVTVDQNLHVLEINDAASRAYGCSRNDTIGQRLDSLPALCKGGCLEILQETIRKKQPQELDRVPCPQPDGPDRVLTLSTAPLLNGRAEFSGAVLVVRDDTRLDSLERDLQERRRFHNIIGRNEAMQRIYALIEDLADVETTVLITGESGTGKELVAEALHYQGTRSDKPLVKVNCTALSENLLESELFGHVKGAFTGAIQNKIGRFQRADGGTIFLDEIGDMSPQMQLRLLRVLQAREFERVGDSVSIRVDVRVVAATNQDLEEKVRRGEFREDLYYRLKVVEIWLPPLEERLDDLPLLVDHFLTRFNRKFNKKVSSVSDGVLDRFMEYRWPGNVRELEHAMEHAVLLSRQPTITPEHLPRQFGRARSETLPGGADGREAIVDALRKTGWNKARAARLLGISRTTIYRRINELDIRQDPY